MGIQEAVRPWWQPDRQVVHFNWISVSIVGLMLAVQGLALVLLNIDLFPAPPQQVDRPSVGLVGVGILVVESLILVGLYVAYRRLPAWLQETIAKLLRGGFIVACLAVIALLAGALLRYGDYAALAQAGIAVGGWTGVCFVFYWYDQYSWVLHNGVAFTAAVGGVFVTGLVLSPAVVVVLQVALLVWDYVAVELTDIMSWLVDFSSSVSLPNYFVFPATTTLSLDTLAAMDIDELGASEQISGVVGVGDFVIPGALPLSIAVQAGEWSVVSAASLTGICIGVGVLYAQSLDSDEGAPGLPILNMGAIAGYGAGMVIAALPVVA